MTDGKAREMARDLVRGSIIEDAVAQFIAQILKHAHDERIKPLRDRAERLEAALRWYEARVSDCRKITREGDTARHELDRDGGQIARAALKGADHE